LSPTVSLPRVREQVHPDGLGKEIGWETANQEAKATSLPIKRKVDTRTQLIQARKQKKDAGRFGCGLQEEEGEIIGKEGTKGGIGEKS